MNINLTLQELEELNKAIKNKVTYALEIKILRALADERVNAGPTK